jgi:glucose/arabinose dehydrogenase
MRKTLTILLFLLPALIAAEVNQGPSQSFTYEILTDGLEHPWSLAFLPDGRMLVTERPGRLRLISAAGELHPEPIGGLPPIKQHGQGGLLDVVLHPDFKNNRLVYFSYAEADDHGVGTAVARGQLRGHRLEQVEVIFRLLPKSGGKQHFGSKVMGPDTNTVILIFPTFSVASGAFNV